MSAVFSNYFKQQWILGRIDAEYVADMVAKGRLTQEEADTIIAIER